MKSLAILIVFAFVSALCERASFEEQLYVQQNGYAGASGGYYGSTGGSGGYSNTGYNPNPNPYDYGYKPNPYAGNPDSNPYQHQQQQYGPPKDTYGPPKDPYTPQNTYQNPYGFQQPQNAYGGVPPKNVYGGGIPWNPINHKPDHEKGECYCTGESNEAGEGGECKAWSYDMTYCYCSSDCPDASPSQSVEGAFICKNCQEYPLGPTDEHVDEAHGSGTGEDAKDAEHHVPGCHSSDLRQYFPYYCAEEVEVGGHCAVQCGQNPRSPFSCFAHPYGECRAVCKEDLTWEVPCSCNAGSLATKIPGAETQINYYGPPEECFVGDTCHSVTCGAGLELKQPVCCDEKYGFTGSCACAPLNNANWDYLGAEYVNGLCAGREIGEECVGVEFCLPGYHQVDELICTARGWAFEKSGKAVRPGDTICVPSECAVTEQSVCSALTSGERFCEISGYPPKSVPVGETTGEGDYDSFMCTDGAEWNGGRLECTEDGTFKCADGECSCGCKCNTSLCKEIPETATSSPFGYVCLSDEGDCSAQTFRNISDGGCPEGNTVIGVCDTNYPPPAKELFLMSAVNDADPTDTENIVKKQYPKKIGSDEVLLEIPFNMSGYCQPACDTRNICGGAVEFTPEYPCVPSTFGEEGTILPYMPIGSCYNYEDTPSPDFDPDSFVPFRGTQLCGFECQGGSYNGGELSCGDNGVVTCVDHEKGCKCEPPCSCSDATCDLCDGQSLNICANTYGTCDQLLLCESSSDTQRVVGKCSGQNGCCIDGCSGGVCNAVSGSCGVSNMLLEISGTTELWPVSDVPCCQEGACQVSCMGYDGAGAFLTTEGSGFVCNTGGIWECDPPGTCSCGCGPEVNDGDFANEMCTADKNGTIACVDVSCNIQTVPPSNDLVCPTETVLVGQCLFISTADVDWTNVCGSSNVCSIVHGDCEPEDELFTYDPSQTDDNQCDNDATDCNVFSCPGGQPIDGTLECVGGYWGCVSGSCNCQPVVE